MTAVRPRRWRTVARRTTRTLARAPIAVYHAGYGSIFGHRLLMIEHTGRTTGRPRHVVLEVVGRPAHDRYIVAAGTGTTADWYRNVRREPRVRVWAGSDRCLPASARILDEDDARGHLDAYRAQRPRTWRFLAPIIARSTSHRAAADDELFHAIPLVELTLHRPHR